MEDVIEVKDAPPMKKFKQVLLSFKPISSKSPAQPASNSSKKRKLSDQESPSAKAPKTIKQASQDNFKTPVVENDPEVSSSSEADNGNLVLPIIPVLKNKNKSTRSNLLEKFVRKSSHEEITSTNEVIEIDPPANLAVKEIDSNTVEISSTKTPEKPSKEEKLSSIANDQKTSTPKSGTEKTNVKPKIQLNCNSVVKIDKDGKPSSPLTRCFVSLKKLENEVVVISDDDRASNTKEDNGRTATEDSSSDEDNTPLDTSNSNDDESKIDVSITSTPGKSSTGFDSSMSETPVAASGENPKSATGTPTTTKTPGAKNPRSSSKLSEKKKQERAEMRQRVKEQKEKERAEKKAQKEREIQEKKEKLEAARQEKERIKKEEKEQKEREKREKMEKLEQEKLEKQQLKEEERKKKQEILDAKMEEKKKKEEEKKLKEEEKKMKEEEKRREEEEKLAKQRKVKAAFEGFFVKNTASPKPVQTVKVNQCKYIQVKEDTVRAPSVWRVLNSTSKSQIDSVLKTQDTSLLYIDTIKSKTHKPLHADPDQYRPKKNLDEELIIHDSETVKKFTHHVKYLFFHTNYRPPYYGTWRKKSAKLSGRNPFKTDTDLFDYEVDSDDEWEEEEPGESLSASEGEDGDEKEEEEDDDGGWMVPHGYLSEDECCDDDKEITPEILKARQQAKEVQWEAELKRQCQPVKVKVIGCHWEGEETAIEKTDMDILDSFKAVCFNDVPVDTTLSVEKQSPSDNSGTDRCATPSSCKGWKTKSVPEDAMPDLIKLVHGNFFGIKKLIHEFRVYWKQKTSGTSAGGGDGSTGEKTEPVAMDVDEDDSPKKNLNESLKEESTPAKEDQFSISKRQLELKITAIAVREKRGGCKKICWHVHESVLKQYNLEELTYPNTWQYVTVIKPKKEEATEDLSSTSSGANNNINNLPTSETDQSSVVVDENETPQKVLPKDQRSIMDFAKKLAHPPEILPKPEEVVIINGAKTIPEPIKVCKPNVLKLLNAAAKPVTPAIEVKSNIVKPVVNVLANPVDTGVDVKTNTCIVKPVLDTVAKPMDNGTETKTKTINTVEVNTPMEITPFNEDSSGCIILD